MINITNIKQLPIEIGRILCYNPKIAGYLHDDSTDPQEYSATYDEMVQQHYICLYPVGADGSIQDFDRNTYMVLLLDSVDIIADANSEATIGVYFITDVNHLLIRGAKNRLLELVDYAVDTLQNAKLTCAGEIQIERIQFLNITTNRVGYKLVLHVSDQPIERTSI